MPLNVKQQLYAALQNRANEEKNRTKNAVLNKLNLQKKTAPPPPRAVYIPKKVAPVAPHKEEPKSTFPVLPVVIGGGVLALAAHPAVRR